MSEERSVIRTIPSYVHGTSTTPLSGETIGGLFDRICNIHAGNEALVVCHQQIRWTWSELAERVEACAAGLLSVGLEPGDRVGIWSPNSAEWVITQFATARAGLILVNINPAYRPRELAYALNKTGCRALITAFEFKTSHYTEILKELAPEIGNCRWGDLRAKVLPDLRFLVQIGGETEVGFMGFDEISRSGGAAERGRLKELSQVLQFDDPINIQFTSGTTGTPKAATLTHHNIVNNAFFCAEAMGFSRHDRLCIPVPMYHCFGMVLGTLLCVTHGATMVFPSAGFDAAAVLDAVETEQCTALHGVPTMFISELDDPTFTGRDLTSLRTGIMAGAPCPVELMRRVISDMHLTDITIAYGMTETGPVSFQTSIGDPLDRRVTTVGRVLPHTEVKIVDADGRIVPTGVEGELLTRGYCVMPGYWEDPEKTAENIDASGWIKSGDIAILDNEGYCQIVGRLKDMIIRGGENIYPREIEEFLYEHPAIDEVEVFGVPDPKFGEQICAWIRVREGASLSEDEVREFCRDKIAHFKIPHYIRFVTEFPMTVTGKVQKFRMREIMARELDIDVT